MRWPAGRERLAQARRLVSTPAGVVAVVVLALVGIAVGLWLSESKAELDDRAGVVADWRIQRAGGLAGGGFEESGNGVGVVVRGPRRFAVIWGSNPCADHPSIVVAGSPLDLTVTVDPRPPGCDDSLVPWRVVVTTNVDIAPGAVNAQLAD